MLTSEVSLDKPSFSASDSRIEAKEDAIPFLFQAPMHPVALVNNLLGLLSELFQKTIKQFGGK